MHAHKLILSICGYSQISQGKVRGITGKDRILFHNTFQLFEYLKFQVLIFQLPGTAPNGLYNQITVFKIFHFSRELQPGYSLIHFLLCSFPLLYTAFYPKTTINNRIFGLITDLILQITNNNIKSGQNCGLGNTTTHNTCS